MRILSSIKQKLNSKITNLIETGSKKTQQEIKEHADGLKKFDEQTDNVNKMLLAEILIQTKFADINKIESIQDAEFKVYSQFGQDGIIQYLIKVLDIPNKTFIEFGVQTYHESTTKFLLMHNKWKGLAMDGDKNYIDTINSDSQYWQYDFKARNAFITKDNINDLITKFTDEKDIGLLVVDIDGNDYWVWEAIDVVSPRIVVCEYNNLFGPDKSVTIPYKDDFVFSNHAYYGTSLRAIVELGDKKGYDFVGCNSSGNDAFFVRRDVIKSPLRKVSIEQGFQYAKFRYSNYHLKEERLREFKNEQLHDFHSGKVRSIKEIYEFED
jgi:hypothetical protein